MCYLRLQNLVKPCKLKSWMQHAQLYPLLWKATLHSIDDALTPAANWVLALPDMEKSLEETMSVKITVDNIKSFQWNIFCFHFESKYL